MVGMRLSAAEQRRAPDDRPPKAVYDYVQRQARKSSDERQAVLRGEKAAEGRKG